MARAVLNLAPREALRLGHLDTWMLECPSSVQELVTESTAAEQV